MTTARRSVMWPLLIIVLGGVWLLALADAFPNAIEDLLRRAWPALLILFGLDVLVGRRRIGLMGRGVSVSLVALILVVALVVSLVWVAYGQQADALLGDNLQTFSQVLPDEMDTVRVEIDVLRTKVTLSPAAAAEPRTFAAEFAGSNDSTVTLDWTVQGGIGVLRIVETQSESFPRLEEYGLGTLTVTLPRDVLVEDIRLNADRGDVSANFRPLNVEQIEFEVARGDFALILPEINVLQGTLSSDQGGVQVSVPQGMRLIVEVERGNPRYNYDTSRYDLLADGTLKDKDGEPYQYKLDVSVRNGSPLAIEDLAGPGTGPRG